MLEICKEIFSTNSIEADDSGRRLHLHSHTSLDQCLFIQKMFDEVKPQRTLEVGLAYGISSLFILEKHKQYGSQNQAHLIIEPYPWGNTAIHNFQKAGVLQFAKIINQLSDEVLPALYLNKHSIQMAYLDTTKLFDVVLQDFYFIDKILDINGIIIIDDCDTTGINLVARFILGLENYEIAGAVHEQKQGRKFKLAEFTLNLIFRLLPFKKKVFPNFSFKSSAELGINYRCIAFKKKQNDKRNWDAKQIL